MKNTGSIAWPQVTVLLLLNIFLIKSWLIYDNFQPVLLANFNLQDRKFHFDIIHLVVMVLVPVLAGGFSDRFFRNSGSKFLLITVGMSITAVLFMATGSVVHVQSASGNSESLCYLFLGLFTLWMIGMNLFNSPANSFLEKYAPVSSLPLIVGIYTLLAELILAFEPRVEVLVKQVGVVPTLLSAGGVLALLGFIFFKINTKNFTFELEAFDKQPSKRYIVKIIIIGLLLGAAIGLVKFYLSAVSGAGLDFDPFYVLIIAALAAVPIGLLLRNGKLQVAYSIGLGLVAVSGTLLATRVYYLGYIGLGLGLSALSVSAFPMALRWAPPQNIALCTGLFFGSAELTEGILEILYT